MESGAEESVWPAGWLNEEPMALADTDNKRLVNANGHEMAHFGRKQVQSRRKADGDQIMSLVFEVTDVTKPLVAVRRIIDRANEVHFN